ncbi:MAG TPA: hypothetical protein PLT65_05540 [Bacilli bacterium]|nr:hypothetical protein [Bacilli bacterium]
MDWDDLTGWMDNIDLDPMAAGISLICTLYLAISFFDDPFNMGMSSLPLAMRIITVILCPVVLYIVANKMINK